MNARVAQRVRVLVSTAVVTVTALSATARARYVVDDLQYEGRVVVAADGNGWVAARFPTTVDGKDVTYYLHVWTGCSEDVAFEHDERCPAPVAAIAVTLNGEVVLRKAPPTENERIEVALHLVGTTDNEIMVSGEGERGAAAHFAIVAARSAGE